MPSLPRRRFLHLTAAALAAPHFTSRSLRAAEPEWTPLFDGKSLANWKPTEFAGRGEVEVRDGQILLGAGSDLTGVSYTGPLPRQNYEVALEAQRVQGGDFFCGLTFPVGAECVTFIVGGWGGAVVGISSIDGNDASENETTKAMKFDDGRWVRIRVRVAPGRLGAWIDDEQTADVDTAGKTLSMRAGEIELGMPFSVCSFRTQAALREVRLRRLA